MTNQLEIVVVDKQRTTVATEVALPNDRNIRKKKHEKVENKKG